MRADLFRLHADREVRHWWFLGRRRIMLDVLDALVPRGMDRLVIDVGCGTGANVAAIAAARRCVGIDVSQDSIALAREHYPHCEFRVGYAPADLGDLVAEADMFLLMDVLEHVRDDVALLTSVLAAAKPGAMVFITVPAGPALWSPHDVTHMHYRRYTYERLSELWRDAAIEPLVVAGLNRRLLPIIRRVRSLQQRHGHAHGPDETDLSMPPALVNRLLTAVLAGEGAGILRRLEARRTDAPPAGVSLLAVLRRGAGPLTPRALEPALAAQDLNDPEAR